MIAYLVMTHPRDNGGLPYAEQYKVFTNKKKALDWAVECGMVDQFGMGVNMAVGVMTKYMCGNVDVSFMPIEIVGGRKKKSGHWRTDNVAV